MSRLSKNQQFKHLNSQNHDRNWRTYQSGLRRSAFKRRVFVSLIKYATPVVFLIVAVYLGWGNIYGVFITDAAKQDLPRKIKNESIVKVDSLDKKEVQTLLGDRSLNKLESPEFKFIRGGKTFRVQTSLNTHLNDFLSSRLDRKHAKWIGIVIMEASSGRIVTMLGYDKSDPAHNPCTDNRFPAASIFKIVTASAAVEKCGYAPDTLMAFNGSKYTLYKSQLKKRNNRYTHRISLRDSFAQSINPVFGKIGVHCLNKSDLENYAEAFGFNQHIPFELPLPPSPISISEDPYHWAEIASGFNRETRLTPIHGALLTATVLNNGWLIEPTVIENISDESGKTVYKSRRVLIKQAMTEDASKILIDLMTATVKSGTSRKYFRRYRRDKVLSRLIIGGKTGSIYNQSRDAKIDWFVGFARQKETLKQITLSILVAHGKYIGKRASVYARTAIREYFKDLPKSAMASGKTDKRS